MLTLLRISNKCLGEIHSRLINPKSKNFPWDSHASIPTVLNLKKNLFRIFYSPRNKNKMFLILI